MNKITRHLYCKLNICNMQKEKDKNIFSLNITWKRINMENVKYKVT